MEGGAVGLIDGEASVGCHGREGKEREFGLEAWGSKGEK
jgi:hypothetical protein